MESQDRSSESSATTFQDSERWALGAGGVALISLALRRGLLLRTLVLGAGAGMLYRAYTGESPIEALMRFRLGAIPLGAEDDTVVIERSIVIEKPRHDIYRFFRNFENLPRFMRHLESVQVHNGRSHWRARAPGGMSVEWDAEILEERPGDLLRWRSLPGSDVTHFGSVRFDDANGVRGTEVTVHLEYVPPGGSIGQFIARLLGEDPETEVEEDLQQLKDMLERDETIDAREPANAVNANANASS
jgi:uncharacterized membrane protein